MLYGILYEIRLVINAYMVGISRGHTNLKFDNKLKLAVKKGFNSKKTP